MRMLIGEVERVHALRAPQRFLEMEGDDRVLDGAVAARLLQDLVDVLGHPNLLLW